MKRVRRLESVETVSESMKAIGRRLAREAGIRPLQPGESRPDDFYVVRHFDGKPIIKDRNAVVIRDPES